MIQIRPLRAAFVKCEEESNFPVRLVDGSSNTDGVVEIFFNDRWGKVCSYGWDSADASVVCRQLGFHGLNVSVIYNRQSQTVDYLMNVDCTGDEAKLADCGYNGWNAHCFKYAGVMCQMAAKEYPVRLIGGNSSTEGIVEILFNGQWVNVSSNEWDDAAAGVVCRQLGLHGPSKAVIYLHTPSSMQGSDGVFLEDVRCNGDEQRLADCFYARWGIEQFFSNERLGVICSTEHYSVFPIRLIGGLTPKSGLIQLFYLNQWGVVCDENWSEAEAKVVCRQLGFEGHSLPTVNSVSWQSDSDPVYQTSFHCLGDEESLTSCMRNSGKHRSSMFCYQKIGVVCQESVDFYPIRLAGGLSYEAGRIEVYFQGYWGIIQDCSDTNNWGIEEANVACNQLGFNGARASVFHSIYGDGTGLILMESVDCSENFEVFGGTCPPPEAVPRPNGQPTIDVIAPLGQSVASVFWTKPTLVLPLNHSTESSRCVPADADSSPYPCQSGSSFNITSQFAISHGRDTAVQYVVTDLDEVDSNFKCTFFVSVRDDEKPTITCPDNITKVAEYGFQYITANWTEPVGTDNSDIVSTISNVPHSPPIQLGFGIHVFTYTATDGSLNTNFCTFAVTVKKMKVGSCPSDVTSDTTHGLLTWPVTEAGSHAESFQRCPIYTERAGWAKAVRHCTFDNLAGSATWEAPQILSCGENRSRVTVEDVAQIPISRHNVLEVAKFLAEKSYKDWSTQRIDAVVEILNNITRLGPDGEPNVTNAVIDTVDNIAKALATFEQSQYLSKESLVSMLRTVQKHVSATLARKGVVHIQKDSIHVEAVSANLSWARNGLSFILEDGLTSEQRGSTQAGRSRLVGSEVRVYGGEVLQSHSVRAAVTLPGNMVKRLPERDGNTSLPHMNVSFIIYADDTMFPSAFVKGSQSGNQSAVVVPGPVISLAVEDVTLVNLSEPVVIEFETVASSSTESATCVFWDFTLEGGVGDWSSIGCEFQGLTNGRYTCLCNHEAIFAVLVELGEEFQTNRGSLDLIAQISCIGSTSTYLIVIIAYLFLRKARAGKAGHVFLQFLFSLLMIYAVFLAGVNHARHLRSGCVVVAALLHYLPLATLMWTAVEVRHIYNSMLHGSSTDSSSCVILTSLVAWASPLIVTGITVTLALDHYGSVDSCLLVPGLPLYLGFLVPVGLILTHNTITTIAAVKVNFCSAEDGLPSSQVVARLICGTLTWVLFLAILCFGFLLIYSTRSVFSIVFSALNFAEIVVVCTLACVHRTKETPISGTQKGPQEGSKEEDEEDKDFCSEEETPSSLSNAVKSVDCQGTRVTSHTEIALEEI
ncbi:uncharacterized protein LOC110978050 [Acanthaster planci]|uniref:Uncharacterized protein LOC110978050 n=1 Tax=Acanthaster planci TaxID=133434 RepID=A0A8B7Y5B4_ACAPL|nr:uncharacterized protein LOC110978050 [Acanthaster planci]